MKVLEENIGNALLELSEQNRKQFHNQKMELREIKVFIQRNTKHHSPILSAEQICSLENRRKSLPTIPLDERFISVIYKELKNLNNREENGQSIKGVMKWEVL